MGTGESCEELRVSHEVDRFRKVPRIGLNIKELFASYDISVELSSLGPKVMIGV